MNLQKRTKQNSLFPFLVIIFTFFALVFAILPQNLASTARASDLDDLYEELEKIKNELEKIKNDKLNVENKINSEKNLQNQLSSEIYNLSNSIEKLQLDILEKETEVKAKETEIKILEEEITETYQKIEEVEANVATLEEIAKDIVTTIYIETRTNSVVDLLLLSDGGQSFLSQLQYHTALGAQDQNALQNLEDEKTILEQQRDVLEDDKLEIEKLAEQIKKEKELQEKDEEKLSAQKNYKNNLLADSKVAAAYYGSQYSNLTDEEMKKEAELDFILQQIVSSATKPKGYAVKGQVIATQGSNGCSTGPHTHFGFAIGRDNWVDPCRYLPGRNFWWGYCGGSGEIRHPYNDPFYSSRGYVWYHKGIDMIAGPDKLVRAAHNGYYFEETPGCSNSWCSVGCKGPINPCVKICEDVNCLTGKISIYCHVNFL